MNNNKVKEIIKFSFYKDIQNKWFIIFNIITLISLLILMNFNNISSLLNFGDKGKIFEIAILDSNNLMYSSFSSKILENEGFNVSQISENSYTTENIPDDFAIIEAYPNEEQLISFSIISKEGIQGSKYEKMLDALNYSRNMLFAQKYDIEENDLDILQSDLDISRIMLSVDAEDSTAKDMIKLISSALTYFIAILIFSKLSNEIAQEKQSKSSEYILTTVSAKEYLFAKIFSNVAIIIIQGIFLLAYYYIATLFSRIFTIASTDMTLSASMLSNAVNIEIVLYILALIVYNVLNIILLCIIQAALAAKTASISEAGNTMTLLTTVIIICYVIASTVIDPYSKVNVFLAIISCLPIASEFFIPALLVIGQCHIWQIVLSLALLVITIPVSFNVCSKIFKNGILDYTRIKKKRNEDENIEQRFLLKRKMKELGFVIGLAVLIYVGLQSIFSLLSTFILGTLLGNIFTETELTLIMQIILQIISLGIASIFVLAYCNRHTGSKQTIHIPSKTKVKLVFVAIFLVFLLQLFLSVILYPPLGLDYDITDMFDVSKSSSIMTKIITVIAVALTPAIFEELFFRKAIIDFTSRYGRKFALVFSALLFGILHMNLSQGLFAFIMGLIMGAIYLYTKDIKLTMLIHFINNGFAALAMILSEFWIIIISILLFAALITGFVFLIKTLIKKSSRDKILSLCKEGISTELICKYKYIFTDYTFDVSIVLVILMSILTENLLR